MYLLDHEIKCKGRGERIEIFPFSDCHVGKFNCAEGAIKKQIGEILRRQKIKDRQMRVLFLGDQVNAINPKDARRFDFGELADWFFEDRAVTVKERLSNLVDQEVKHAVELFKPVAHLTLGALEGNHEKAMKTHQNVAVHTAFCDRMGIVNLTDEAVIRIRFLRANKAGTTVVLFIRHGYGGGRTEGAEPNKLGRMLAEWECADVCLTGHTHTYCLLPPKPVLYIPRSGDLPEELFLKYRFAANAGCWLESHKKGVGCYESAACYPARPMMTLKIVIWPFWHTFQNGQEISRPKIELREYPIL